MDFWHNIVLISQTRGFDWMIVNPVDNMCNLHISEYSGHRREDLGQHGHGFYMPTLPLYAHEVS